MNKPQPTEHHPYFQRYIDLVRDGDFQTLLPANTQAAVDFFTSIPPEKHNYQYDVDKWTIKQVLMHIIDTERVFSYRALVCLRGDSSITLPPMDEDHYAAHVDISHRSMQSLVDEFVAVRLNTALLFQHATEEQTTFLATMPTHAVSARALAFILLGHTLHHMKVIQERYL